VAAAEPISWEATGVKSEKSVTDMPAGSFKKAWKAGNTAGVATVEVTAGGERRRRCPFFHSLGYDKSQPAFTCKLLKPVAKKRALGDSRLCLFCMRHSSKSEYFGKGSDKKPAWKVPECKGLHAESLHDLLMGEVQGITVYVYNKVCAYLTPFIFPQVKNIF
jgi:hypothetical protein